MKFSKESLTPWRAQQLLTNELKKIPKKNKKLFLQRLVEEIGKAQKEDYA